MVRAINEGFFFEFEQSGMEWGEQPWVGYRSKLCLLIEGSPKQSGSQAQASLDLKPRRGPAPYVRQGQEGCRRQRSAMANILSGEGCCGCVCRKLGKQRVRLVSAEEMRSERAGERG